MLKRIFKRRKRRPRFFGSSISSLSDITAYPEDKIEPYIYTDDPTISWEILKAERNPKQWKSLPPDEPLRDDFIRFVCMSDTHGKHEQMQQSVPFGDVLIVAGDFTSCGHPVEVTEFNEFLSSQPHRYKVIIPGNHELTFDPFLKMPAYNGIQRLIHFKSSFSNQNLLKLRKSIARVLEEAQVDDVRDLLTACVYLEDCEVELFGLKIYGSPWIPSFDNWAFNLDRGEELLKKWDAIPANIDVLITHTPPLGHGDLIKNRRLGDVELLQSIRKRIRPRFHVFGHVHEGHGCLTDGTTVFVNASICDNQMQPRNTPVCFDVPLPPGYFKNRPRHSMGSRSSGSMSKSNIRGLS